MIAWRISSLRSKVARPTTLAHSRCLPALALTSMSARFEADHDDYSSILLKALADRLAEATCGVPARTRAQGILGLCG